MSETESSVEDRVAAKLFGSDQADQAEPQVEDQSQPEEESGEEVQTAPAVEEVDVEFDGWKGKIPSKLKGELDKVSDSTRKWQEAADQRRLLEHRQRLQQEDQAFQQSASEELKQLSEIDSALSRFNSVDLATTPAEELTKMSLAVQRLNAEKQRLEKSLGEKRGEFKKKLFNTWDNMAQEAAKVVSRQIPEWEKSVKDIAEYALAEGYPFELITGYDRASRERVGPGVVDPTFARTLYKSWKWDQLQANKDARVQRANGKPPVLKPGATDARSANQVSQDNYRKAMKSAKTDMQRAQVIGDRVAQRFKF